MSTSTTQLVYTNTILAPELVGETYGTTRTFYIQLDDDVVFGSAGCFIAGFDYSFQDDNHELHALGLGIDSLSYDPTTHKIEVTLWMQMDKNKKQKQNYKDGSYLSPGSTIDVVTVVSQVTDGPDQFAMATAVQDSNDAANGASATYDVGQAPASGVGAVAGMAGFYIEDTYGGNIHNKVNNFVINAGEAADPAFTGSTGNLKDVISVVNTNGGVKFTGTAHSTAALNPSADNSFGFYVAQHQLQEPSATFGSDVVEAYAVIKQLTNNGAGKSDSNAISSFTCKGLTVAPNRDNPKQVDITWPNRGGDWSDGVSSWDNIVDYLIIAVFDKTSSS